MYRKGWNSTEALMLGDFRSPHVPGCQKIMRPKSKEREAGLFFFGHGLLSQALSQLSLG